MDLTVISLDNAITLLLLLLIGIGPKIALVPFLEKTKDFPAEQQRAIGRRMVITAVAAAVIVFVTGALLLKLLHITPGAVAVGGGIILALLAVRMALGPGDEVVKEVEAPTDPESSRLSIGGALSVQSGWRYRLDHRFRGGRIRGAPALVLGLVLLVVRLTILSSATSTRSPNGSIRHRSSSPKLSSASC